LFRVESKAAKAPVYISLLSYTPYDLKLCSDVCSFFLLEVFHQRMVIAVARPCKVQRGPTPTLVCPLVNICAKLFEQFDNLEVATAGGCGDGDAQSRHIQGLVRRMDQLSMDQLSMDQLSMDQLSMDQLSMDQLSMDQLSMDQLSMDQLSIIAAPLM
jgi:hypothetical protein